MSYKFKYEICNWTSYRQLPKLVEVDFHWSEFGRYHDHLESMKAVCERTIEALMQAQKEGKQYVLFTHGASTSRPGRTTANSQVHKVMRSKEATPLVIRKECIKHHTAFVAAIRPLRKQD